MDVYKKPSTPRCDGLVLLECFATSSGDEVRDKLPPFLDIIKNVTGDPDYSMFNLSLKSDSSRNDSMKITKDAVAARLNGTANESLNGSTEMKSSLYNGRNSTSSSTRSTGEIKAS